MLPRRNGQNATSKVGYVISAALIATVPTTPIVAQNPSIFDGCLQALDAGNLQEAMAIAERIKQFSPVVNNIDQQIGAECISRATGIETSYSSIFQRFLTHEELDLMAASEEAALAEAEAAEMVRRQLAADALSRAFAQEGAWRATLNACKELYLSSENEALVNSVCSPIFLELGLPDQW